MSQDGFTLYSTAHISCEEYMSWLHQLNAVLIPEEGGAFDARISTKDIYHIWTYLFREDDLDRDMEEINSKRNLPGKPHLWSHENAPHEREVSVNDIANDTERRKTIK